MPQKIIDLLKNGVEANKKDKFRVGNLICLPDKGKLIVSGDIHGHRRNFEKLINFSDLENNPESHIVIQEIIHGGQEDAEGGCLSYKLLFDAIDFKTRFPDRVHILMGNHDTSFISSKPIMKDGKEMNRCICSALEREYKQNCKKIENAIREFLLSQPLAVRTDNRIWLSHSLPNDRNSDKFDMEILNRELTLDDITKTGSAYYLTWGRKHSQTLLDKMAKLFDVDIFILGHQPQSQGWAKAGNNLIIISSEHNHGCLIAVDLQQSYSLDQIINSIVPLASIT